MNQSPLDFRDGLTIVLGSGLSIAAVNTFGIGWVLLFHICVVLIFLFIGWCAAFHYQPVLARNGTALAFVFVCLGSLFVCWIYQSQEASRRTMLMNRLKEVGLSLRERQSLLPDEQVSDPSENASP